MYGLEVSSFGWGLGIFLWVCRGWVFFGCARAVPGDVVLTQALSRYGKLVSSIKKLAAFPLY